MHYLSSISKKTISKITLFSLAFILIISNLLNFSCKVGDFSDTVDVVIRYYYNDTEDNDKVKTSSFILHKKKGSYLTESPTIWSDGDWIINNNVRVVFGYVGDGRTGARGKEYIFDQEDNVWEFKTRYGTTFRTSEPIMHSLYLEPSYRATVGEDTVDFSISYYKKEGNEYKIKTEERSFRTREVEANTILLNDATYDLELFAGKVSSDDPDYPELGLGYTDPVDYNHKFYFDNLYGTNNAPVYEFVVLNDDGTPSYTTFKTIDLIVPELNNKTIMPLYLSAGYEPITSDDPNEGIDGVEQVFIPNNVDKRGDAHPFPYSAATPLFDPKVISDSRRIESGDEDSNGGDMRDDLQENVPLNNMYVMDTPITKTLFDAAKGATGDKYTFKSSLKTDEQIINNATLLDAYALANMCTEFYNSKHKSSPLELVYFIEKVSDEADSNYLSPSSPKFDTPFTNATLDYVTPYYKGDENDTSRYRILTNNFANGFRVPRDHEVEYFMRIVTDERQVPNKDVMLRKVLYPTNGNDEEYYYTVIAPNDENKMLNYFQSAKGAFFDEKDALRPAFVGTGSGLAVWDGKRYQQSDIRQYIKASGRANNSSYYTSTTDYYRHHGSKDTDMVNAIKGIVAEGDDPDFNLRNGAGIYGMLNFANIVDSRIPTSTSNLNSIAVRGGEYADCSLKTLNPRRFRIGYIGHTTDQATNGSDYKAIAVRLVRSVQ